MEIKFVSSKTDKDIIQSKTDISFKYMTDNLEQLKVVNEVNKYRINDNKFLLKSNVINSSDNYIHNMKSAEGNSYDHLIVEFDSTQSREDKITISEIVIKSLQNIEQKYYKNPGKDKITGKEKPLQEMSLKGKHVAFDLHGDHLHLFVSSYSVEKEYVEGHEVLKVNPQTSLSNTSMLDIAINEINNNLAEAGYLTFNKIANPNFKTNTTNTIPSVATKEVVSDLIEEVVNTDNVDIDSLKEVLNKNIEDLPKNLDMAIITKNKAIAQKEIEKAYQTILEQTHFVNQLNKSENILIENNKLKSDIEQKELVINEKQEQILLIENQKEDLNKVIVSLQENEEANKFAINSLNERIEELNKQLTDLSNDYENVEEELKEKAVVLESKNEELQQFKTTNNHLAKALDLHEETIRELKRNADLQKQQHDKEIAEIKELLKSQSATIEQQNKQLVDLKSDNDILVNEVARKDKDISILNELYKEVKSRLSSTTNRLKNVVSKIANADIKESLKSVVMDNNQFEKSLEAIDKEPNNDKMEKIRALREKFAQGKKQEETKETPTDTKDKGFKPK
jgi:hypothetical protein